MSDLPPSTSEARSLFCATWSIDPTVVASAPGRVNLIGEHTDYNDGFVLPMAINRRTSVALGPGPGGGVAFISAQHPTVISVGGPPWGVQDNHLWVNYPLGVLALMKGDLRSALAIAVASDVPTGAGLSSSAALEAATAKALESFLGLEVLNSELALLCQRAEHQYAGVRCGIMDQMASILGGVILLDCRTLVAESVPLPGDVSVVILDSGIPRGLTSSQYNERRSQCEDGVRLMRARWPEISALRDVTPEMLERTQSLLPEVVYRRCRHVVTENTRVLDAVAALRRGNMDLVGRLLGESHQSMRDDYWISLPEIDRLVAIAAAAEGCYGARLTGAGFGGAAVALVAANEANAFAWSVVEQYRAETGKAGSALLVTSDAGARVEYQA